MPKVSKTAIFQNLCNTLRIISFICQSNTVTNDYLYLKNEGRDRGSSNNILFLFPKTKQENQKFRRTKTSQNQQLFNYKYSIFYLISRWLVINCDILEMQNSKPVETYFAFSGDMKFPLQILQNFQELK